MPHARSIENKKRRTARALRLGYVQISDDNKASLLNTDCTATSPHCVETDAPDPIVDSIGNLVDRISRIESKLDKLVDSLVVHAQSSPPIASHLMPAVLTQGEAFKVDAYIRSLVACRVAPVRMDGEPQVCECHEISTPRSRQCVERDAFDCCEPSPTDSDVECFFPIQLPDVAPFPVPPAIGSATHQDFVTSPSAQPTQPLESVADERDVFDVLLNEYALKCALQAHTDVDYSVDQVGSEVPCRFASPRFAISDTSIVASWDGDWDFDASCGNEVTFSACDFAPSPPCVVERNTTALLADDVSEIASELPSESDKVPHIASPTLPSCVENEIMNTTANWDALDFQEENDFEKVSRRIELLLKDNSNMLDALVCIDKKASSLGCFSASEHTKLFVQCRVALAQATQQDTILLKQASLDKVSDYMRNLVSQISMKSKHLLPSLDLNFSSADVVGNLSSAIADVSDASEFDARVN